MSKTNTKGEDKWNQQPGRMEKCRDPTRQLPQQQPQPPPPPPQQEHLTTYTEEELKTITTNFSKQCGEGGSSTVFEGSIDGKKVAVKKMNRDIASIAQYEAERLFLTRLTHKNIITLYGCGQAENQWKYLIMEFMPNDLEERYLGFQCKDVLFVLKQITAALQVVHQFEYDGCKWVYIDLKPQNILIDKENNVKIADFGSMVKENSMPRCYTRHYAAPEVTDGSPKIIQRADIYSLGIVILQLIMKMSPEDCKLQKEAETMSEKGKEHTCHKDLLTSGCTPDDAKQITTIALACTETRQNKRRITLTEIIDRLGQLQVQEQKAKAGPSLLEENPNHLNKEQKSWGKRGR